MAKKKETAPVVTSAEAEVELTQEQKDALQKEELRAKVKYYAAQAGAFVKDETKQPKISDKLLAVKAQKEKVKGVDVTHPAGSQKAISLFISRKISVIGSDIEDYTIDDLKAAVARQEAKFKEAKTRKEKGDPKYGDSIYDMLSAHKKNQRGTGGGRKVTLDQDFMSL